jgi:hypothetical protein
MPDKETARCGGVAREEQAARDARGRLLPGSTANPHGRPPGVPNNSTRLANRRLAAAAERAADVLIAALADGNRWIRVSAAKTILERAALVPEPKADGLAFEWLTARELRLLNRIVDRAQRRKDRGEPIRLVEPPLPALPPAEPEPDEIVVDLEPTR